MSTWLGPVAQSVQRLATGWTVRGSNPGGKRFTAYQDRPWGPPTLCTMGTESFQGVKYGRGVLLTTHPLLVSWSWKSRAIPLPTLWDTTGPVTGTLFMGTWKFKTVKSEIFTVFVVFSWKSSLKVTARDHESERSLDWLWLVFYLLLKRNMTSITQTRNFMLKYSWMICCFVNPRAAIITGVLISP